MQLHSGQTIYFNKYIGILEFEKPTVNLSFPGGILADEMGLGKTVEFLALILLNAKSKENVVCKKRKVSESDNISFPFIEKNPKKIKVHVTNEDKYVEKATNLKVPNGLVKKGKTPNKIALEKWYENTLKQYDTTNSIKKVVCNIQCVCGSTSEKGIIACTKCSKRQHTKCMGYTEQYGPYICPQCWKDEPLLESPATLIVCPPALEEQWCAEICKHVGSGISILKYHGSKEVPIYPTKLRNYDIVITTYSILQNELKLSEANDVSKSKLLQRSIF